MRKWLLVGLLCVSVVGFAAQSFYCSKTISYIYIGDSLAHVQEKCGDPQATETRMIPQTRIVQEMMYRKRGADGKLTFLKVEVSRDTILKLSIDGMHVESTQFCGPLKVGDPVRTVYQTCSRPFMTRHARKEVREVPQLVLTYADSTKLYFDNFKLVKIEP